ncbi:MAG: asparaginase [Candidatus Izemoplasmatales bacterium]|jgi:L-asparaginase|nr:asparaginase [Candidatus Izemoplasmatales bacterium]MDD5601979.1 asparaginase [Candidatus Izemoplasmatales bacterium]MDY0372596.1 asparaginase [Candidatus Izemoplasmatales bacterium]
MGKIYLVFTGGTISMKMDNSNHSVVPALSASEVMSSLLLSFHEYELEMIEFSKLPSPSITPPIMLELSQLVSRLLDEIDTTGVVVVHGTDTLEETAFFLDTVLGQQKPVVVTGSMKSSSELGYDGINNLVSSILVCMDSESIGKGVLVVLNDQINAASEVTKTNTLSLDTFKSLDFGPLGIVDNRQVIYYRSVNFKRPVITTDRIEENVFLLKVCSGTDSKLIDYFLSGLNAKGIVLEALGRGNVPPQMLPGIKRALAAAIPVVITSRCPSGRVFDTYGYEGGGKHLTSLGCIIAPNLNGQKARLLLMLSLAKAYKRDDLIRIFQI